jgi:hypothetical protein
MELKEYLLRKLAFANDMIRNHSFSTESLMSWRGYKRAIEDMLEELSDIGSN